MTTGDQPAIPDLAHTIPLIIQDKGFKTVADQWGKPGDLWYPSVYEHDGEDARWDVGNPSDGFQNETDRPSADILRSRSVLRHHP